MRTSNASPNSITIFVLLLTFALRLSTQAQIEITGKNEKTPSTTTEVTVPVKSVMSPSLSQENLNTSTESMMSLYQDISKALEDYVYIVENASSILIDYQDDSNLNKNITTTKTGQIQEEDNRNLTQDPYEQFIDEEIYYKYNATKLDFNETEPCYGFECPVDKLTHYAGRTTIIVTVVFVTFALVGLSCSTYRHIVRLIPTNT